jgi:hypothetical protein
MSAEPTRVFAILHAAALILMVPSLFAEQNATLSGTVVSETSTVVAGAKISAKNLKTGQVSEAVTDSLGHFQITPLTSGDFEVSVAADGYVSKIEKVTLTGEAEQMLALMLTSAAAGGPAGSAQSEPPNAPSATPHEPSLSDLGFPAEQTQGDVKRQALLDKRTHMLKIHQKLGLITTAPLLATLVTSVGAGGHNTSNTDRTVHMVLGAVTSDLYFTSAYFAIRAPRVSGTTTRGPIRLHKALAWVHGPGMILTPILGALAYDQKSKGEKVHGIASAHGPVAIVTAAAFGAALLSVSVKF